MKKLAILALCTAGALSCFFVYKKAFAEAFGAVNYNDYMAAQRQAAAAQAQAVQNLVVEFQNSTGIEQTIALRLSDGKVMITKVPAYQVQHLSLPQGAQVVLFAAKPFDWPVSLPVDSDLLNKNIKVTLWPMNYAHAEGAWDGAMILDVSQSVAPVAAPRSAPIVAAPVAAPASIISAPMPAAKAATPKFGALGGI
jgi:hypothetical protein